MKGFRKLGDPLFAQGLTSRLRIGTRMTAGGIPAPDQPTGLTATPVSTSQINLAWTDVATTETAYRVYRSTDGTNYVQIGTDLAAGTQAYNDTTPDDGVTYYYKVAAVNAGGETLSAAVSTNTLLLSLANYWKLNEASDGSAPVQRNDSVGTMHMADANTCPSVAGILGNGTQFTIANSERLGASHGGLGNFDFTLAGWFWRDAQVGAQSILGSSNGKIWLRDTGATAVTLRMNDGSDHECAAACSAVGAWSFFVIWYDSTNDLQYLQVNNGVPASVANTGGATAGAFTLYLGAHVGPGFFFGGRDDEVGYWTRILTADERTSLYNSGAGKTYPF